MTDHSIIPVWRVAPEKKDSQQRRELIEQLCGVYRLLGLRGTLKGICMAMVYSAARAVRKAAFRVLASGDGMETRHRDLIAWAVLDHLPGAYLWVYRLLFGPREWVLYYDTLVLFAHLLEGEDARS